MAFTSAVFSPHIAFVSIAGSIPMTPDEYCQQKAAQSGSSFYYSFLFLPPERRRAITALYAFCREVDDAVDEPSDASVAQSTLAWWRSEVAQLFAGGPQHPVTRALASAIEPFGITQARLSEIMDGMEMDLNQSRYPDFAGLQLYCHRVAGVVGALAAAIFGYRNPKTLEYAERLGLAFQLTNIIRDVGEDARKNRIYLPMDELKRFDVSAADILNGRYTDNFARLMCFQAERAKRCYDEALALLPPEDRRTQRPGLVMAAIYRTLLDEIASDGYQVLRQRTVLTPVRKLWIAWRTWVSA
jgi:phytoene synthase